MSAKNEFTLDDEFWPEGCTSLYLRTNNDNFLLSLLRRFCAATAAAAVVQCLLFNYSSLVLYTYQTSSPDLWGTTDDNFPAMK